MRSLRGDSKCDIQTNKQTNMQTDRQTYSEASEFPMPVNDDLESHLRPL